MMSISSRGRYSVRILAFMASGPEGRVFATREISEAEAIPSAYVQQLMTTMRAAGLVASRRGRVGGYALMLDPEDVSVADVLRVSEGPIVVAPCLGGHGCEREAGCVTRALWMSAGRLLEDLFGSVTIADLARAGTGESWLLAGRPGGSDKEGDPGRS